MKSQVTWGKDQRQLAKHKGKVLFCIGLYDEGKNGRTKEGEYRNFGSIVTTGLCGRADALKLMKLMPKIGKESP